MKSFHRINRIVLLLLAFGVAAAVSAQDLTGTLKKVKDSGTITIGYRDASIPFSYLDDNQKPIGYSMDLCYKIVDAVKATLKMPNLKVALQPVTSATRIPLIANGTVDMECGSTTNNIEREQQVSFVVTTFVTANRLMSKAKSKMVNLEDLKGKTLVSTSGTSNLKQVTELNGTKNLGINIVTAADHPAAFQMVESDRAAAFAMDDILLYSLVAQSKNPADYYISTVQLSTEPYGIIVRRGDPEFKKVADAAIVAVMKSGEINKIYGKWFLSPIPPKNGNLNVPMSDALKRVIANPTDSGDPATYR
jgi:glutamate/aspartate transport system substrate-binding protein